MKRPKPVFLLAGGNWRRPGVLAPLFRRILSTVGKPRPRVAYLGAANGDDPSFFKYAGAWFKEAGASRMVPVRLASDHADVARAKAILRASDAVFVSGGDVEEGMRWLRRHRLVPFLRALHRRGVLFFGISAGSIMLGTRWVRWRDDDDDATAELFECLGIAPLLCDTHDEADGWQELRTAVRLLGKGGRGYGIPTGGVLRVSGNGRVAAWIRSTVRFVNRRGQAVRSGSLARKPN